MLNYLTLFYFLFLAFSCGQQNISELSLKHQGHDHGKKDSGTVDTSPMEPAKMQKCIDMLSIYPKDAAIPDINSLFSAIEVLSTSNSSSPSQILATPGHIAQTSVVAAPSSIAFKVKITWHLNAQSNLTAIEPVNSVTLEFFNLNDEPAQSVLFDLSSFSVVMDMGHHAHSTNTCPSIAPEVLIDANKVTISKINFVMASRTENSWFIHNLTANVDDQLGTIERVNIPHKVL